MKQYIVGFDAREDIDASDASWSDDRRETFLLVSSMNQKPLSVDSTVWKSVLGHDEASRLSPHENWVQGTWANLTQLQQAISAIEVGVEYVFVAIVQILPSDEAQTTHIPNLPVSPHHIEDDWKLLGYDIAENTLLSGLMNMGYKAEEKTWLRNLYIDQLNDYHLFRTIADAQHFREWRTLSDDGHGPFHVYAIFRVS